MHRYSMFLVCDCGWWDEPSFGNRWFSEQDHPVCPKCGTSTKQARMRKGRLAGFFRRRFVPFEQMS